MDECMNVEIGKMISKLIEIIWVIGVLRRTVVCD